MTKDNSCARIRIISRVTAIACLLSMALCYKLWLGERVFPLTPVFGFIPQFQHPFDYILAGFAAVLLICIAVMRSPQKLIILFVCVAVFMMLQDQNRLQPWFYQYVLMFFILSFFNFRCDDTRKQTSIVIIFKVMIAAVYFWSGLQKLNPNFLADTFPWLMEPVTNHMAAGSIEHFRFLGYSFPLIETATGICLLIPSLQKLAVMSAIIMHLFILFILSPLGHNYNPVVWPWNVAMILLVLLLFYNEVRFGMVDLTNAFTYHSVKIVFVLFVMMPLLNFFNLWDSYLSHNLYSGNTSGGVIYVSDSVESKLPAAVKPYCLGDMNQNQITIKYWCMMEMGVPAYPEKRNFVAVTNTFYRYAADSSEIYLMYSPKRKLGDK